MPTNLDYALLSANSYAASTTPPDVGSLNVIPMPMGWSIQSTVDNPVTGFTARAYVNGDDVVIAYAGTSTQGGLAQLSRDWLLGNIVAGSGLTLAPQVLEAAEFYLDTLAANPGKSITLTGHSLGGGLASLMAVYFNGNAVTFDTAPFEKAADSAIAVNGLKTALLAAKYSIPAEFSSYVALDFLFGAAIPSPTRVQREAHVASVYLKDEIMWLLQTPVGRVALPLLVAFNPALFLLAANIGPIAGTEQVFDPKGETGNGWGYPILNGDPLDLHSIVLLTAFQQSAAFLSASQLHPELLQAIFTSPLYQLNPQSQNEQFNLLNLFVQRHAAGEQALDAVAQDIQRLTGSLKDGPVAFGLTALDLAMHYGEGVDRSEGLASGPFEAMLKTVSGGIQFAVNPDHAELTADGFSRVNHALGLVYPGLDRFIVSSERYSLQTEGNLVVSATADAKFDLMLGGSGADQLSSADGRDRLFGLDGADILEGGAGSDILVGGLGDDTLSGGAGLDYYYRRAGDGNDRIIEEREPGSGVLSGRIFIVSDTTDTPVEGLFLQQGTAEVWNSQRGGMTLTHSGDWTLTLSDGSTLNLGADVRNGDFGIFLSNTPQAINTDRTILGDLAPVDFDPAAPGIQTHVDDLGNVVVDPAQPQPGRADSLFDSAGNDVIQSFDGIDIIDAFRGGDDRLDGGAGRDIVMGRNGNDVVIGGVDGDLLRGDAGRDKVFGTNESTVDAAIAQLEATPTGVKGDFIDGGTEDDTLVSAADNDALNGGGGNDLIVAGAGDDDVDGDLETAQATFDWSVTRSITTDPSGVTVYNRTYNSVAFAPLSAPGDDVVYGGAGADWLFMSDGNDWVDGGGGDDVAFGDASSDEIFGGAGADRLFGDSAAVPAALHGDDLLDGGDGDDLMNGDGGNDVLFGGEGGDQMFGDSSAAAGVDYLDGEGGNDTILGAGNSDTIYGGTGDDVLQGDSGTGVGDGDDFVNGEAGNDTLFGEAGSDQLDGGDDADLVIGNAGSDAILGGAGDDTLAGDDGNGTGGDADTIDAGDGNDFALGDGGDDFIAGGAGSDQLQGGDGDDLLDGGADGDVLFGEAGNDTVLGGVGNDQLIAGAGDDVLAGGDGDDVYFYFSGDGNDRISDTGGTDFLVFNNYLVGQLRLDVGSLEIVTPDGGAVHLDDFDPDNPLTSTSIEFVQFADGAVLTTQQVIQTLGFHVQGTPADDALSGTALGESIQALAGDDVVFARGGNDTLDLGAGDDYGDGGDGNDAILGGDGNDFLAGGAGVDQLTGGLGDDRVSGGPGNDLTLDGGAGNDTYLIGVGDGQDVAVDTQGVNGVQLLGGLTGDRVTLQRSGNDLLVLVNGTTDRLTARDWFVNPANWNQLGLGDGTMLDRAGVQARLQQNQAPVLTADTASTFEDNAAAVSGNALANDVDPEGRALTVTNLGTRTGTYGTLTLQSTGAYSYTLNNGSTVVQSLAQGQTASDTFGYTASDNDPAGAATASSTITLNIAGRNDAPVANVDFAFVSEDQSSLASGDVLFNDTDVDAGTALRVTTPGTFTGSYGTLVLNADGGYVYTLNNDLAAVQSLGQSATVSESFTYAANDGIASSNTSTLQVAVEGNNDAPVLSIPLLDQTATAGRAFSYTVPLDSFTDVDAGDLLSYSATLADGSDLPTWMSFDVVTQTFGGTAPSDATGSIDVEVTATDGHGDGEEIPSSASDVFSISFVTQGGGGGGGGSGGGNGNEGVGNGEDPPPPGHDDNFNDVPGTGPGNPGAQGGNGVGHLKTAPTVRSLGDLPQKRHVQSGASERTFISDHDHVNGTGGEHRNGVADVGGVVGSMTDSGTDAPESAATQDGTPRTDAPSGDGSVAALLAQDPYYDFQALFDWLANESSASEVLDAAEIARRWSRIARYASESGNGMSDDAHAAAFGWQRFADQFAAANGNAPTSLSQFVGLGMASGLPGFETFRGLEEGMARL